MNLALWLERAGKKLTPDHPAVGLGTRTLRSYGELAGRVARLAGALTDRYGLRPGDRVAIAAKNSPEYLELLYAVWHAGLAAVPANAKLHGARARLHPRAFRRARLLRVARARRRDRAACAEKPRAPDRHRQRRIPGAVRGRSDRAGRRATATISPGCSTPRAPPAGRRARCSRIACWRTRAKPIAPRSMRVAPGDAILHAAPMSHGSGPLHDGARGAARRQRRAGVRRLRAGGDLRRCSPPGRAASMFAAPTMVKRLVECPARLPEAENIRTIVWGGAPMYVEDALKALDRFGPRLAQIYGQGESPMTITTLSREDIADRDHPRWRERLASAGRPYACVEVRVADAEDRALPVGETGEILCRGDMVMPGYWQQPGGDRAGAARRLAAHRRRRRVRRGRLSHAEGPLQGHDHLGRLQHLSARGRGGAAAARRVREVSVIGRPRPRMGRGGGRLRGRRGRAPAELDALCLAHIARFKRPKDYVFVDALPKNNYGKILKTELRELDAARKPR